MKQQRLFSVEVLAREYAKSLPRHLAERLAEARLSFDVGAADTILTGNSNIMYSEHLGSRSETALSQAGLAFCHG